MDSDGVEGQGRRGSRLGREGRADRISDSDGPGQVMMPASRPYHQGKPAGIALGFGDSDGSVSVTARCQCRLGISDGSVSVTPRCQ